MNTVPTNTPRRREATVGDILGAAEARGIAPSDLLSQLPGVRPIAASGVIIRPATDGEVPVIDVQTPTPTELDWAEGNLEGLKTIVQATRVDGPRGQVRIEQSSDGAWWRYGGNVDLRLVDGTYRFKISLYRGANWDDYEWLQIIIDKAKRGAFLTAGWQAYTDRNGNEAYAFRCGRRYVDAGEADLFDSATDWSPQVIVCDDDRCRMLVHEAAGATHMADNIVTDRWQLSVDRYVDAEQEDRLYAVSVHITDSLTDPEVAAFANDLAWIWGSCRRANEKAAA
jgi:hypothetical protein